MQIDTDIGGDSDIYRLTMGRYSNGAGRYN